MIKCCPSFVFSTLSPPPGETTFIFLSVGFHQVELGGAVPQCAHWSALLTTQCALSEGLSGDAGLQLLRLDKIR